MLKMQSLGPVANRPAMLHVYTAVSHQSLLGEA